MELLLHERWFAIISEQLPEPNQANKPLTLRLKQALGLAAVRTLDPIHVGATSRAWAGSGGFLPSSTAAYRLLLEKCCHVAVAALRRAQAIADPALNQI
jgi:hypothetical protein